MKKVQNKKILCIDFLNSDPTDMKMVNSLVESLSSSVSENCWLGKPGYHHKKMVIKKLIGRVSAHREELRKIHRNIGLFLKSFINSNNPSFYNSIISDAQQELKKLESWTRADFMPVKRIYRIGRFKGYIFTDKKTVYRPHDVITAMIEPFLISDLRHLYENGYWNRIKNCLECDKFFISKTLRNQLFCSNKCRFKYHNKEKVISGHHKDYMKQWRELKKRRYSSEHANQKT
jgi:hypothetical protein